MKYSEKIAPGFFIILIIIFLLAEFVYKPLINIFYGLFLGGVVLYIYKIFKK